jgi:DNA mismatch repair protein MutL
MACIRKLPTQLVNKIAAGEVIERPASVVKELVENSLDAGASRIEITVEDGGKKLIRVTDDGAGMDPGDLALAFAPHATSKLPAEDDLYSVRTLGFRGEALASIAAVSHATLRSRTPGADSAWQVTASGGEISDPAPCSAAPGTTVEIRDLFFNTPARRKFLRKTNTEFGHIAEQVTRLALPNPAVAILLRHNGRESMNLPAADSTQQRIGDIFTADTAGDLRSIRSQKSGAISVEGLLGSVPGARSSTKYQYVFLNRRYIRDRLISHAVKEAHRGLLDPKKHPALFLFLSIDPGAVDVNVHPTKIEVRFRDSDLVYREILAALTDTINQAGERRLPSPAHHPPAVDRPHESTRRAIADFFSQSTSQPSRDVREAQAPYGAPAPPSTPAPSPRALDILQIHDTYIVRQTADGMEIIDQHALHERILYNRLEKLLLEGPLPSQGMLVPDTLAVTPAEAAALEQHRDLLEILGIRAEPFGPDTIAIQSFPAMLASRGVGAAAFLRELLDGLQHDIPATGEQALEPVLAMMACKAAVKAGDRLEGDEMRELLDSAADQEKSSSCPHGRPTRLTMTLDELEKRFHRS